MSEQVGESGEPLLGIERVSDGGKHILYLSGALEVSSSTRVEETIVALCEAGCERITVDLTKITFIDSSGLRLNTTDLPRGQWPNR